MKKNNSNLHKARVAKNDEFYTRLEDIEKELKYYKKHFAGKVVFCNCDDPYESNFFKFFALNFNILGLKKLIATCYDGSQIVGTELPLWKDETDKTAWRAVITMDELIDANEDGAIDEDDVKLMLQKEGAVKKLNGNGSFDSEECLELLKTADIVCTNPPFSLFRKFVKTIMKYNKKFLIIGSKNAITYKEIFNYIKNNELWMGINNVPTFNTPNGGTKTFGNIGWYTNLTHPKRNEEIYLYKTYNTESYPKYDNYDAIEVSKVDEIPEDYDGVMGVPITFLDKYCPTQFEIVDINPHFFSMVEQGLPKPKQLTLHNVNKKDPYARILIKKCV